jgi:peroxiredoxin
MTRLDTSPGTLGTTAPPFDLPGVDGKRHTLASVRGANGLVVMFLCNHCPYVKAVIDKIPRDLRELAALGIGGVAIMSNDVEAYPEDSFDNMRAVAARHGFGFPYVYDATQDVARAYGAVCTPDIFGYDRDLRLVYRGRLDDAGRTPREGNRRDLVEAMRAVARGQPAPAEQYASIGCSIKWRK